MGPGNLKIPHRLIIIALVVLGGFFVTQKSVEAAAGINKQINFQGKITNSDGTNVANGNYNFNFKIYTVSSGGTEVWSELTKSLTVTDGIFQTNLGDATALASSNEDSLYLGIEFNGNGEMSPRVRFTAAPYAFNTDLLDGKDWTNPGTIGTSATTLALASNGTSAWTNTSGNLTISTATSGTLAVTSAGALNLTGAGASYFNTTSGSINLEAAGTGTANVQIGDGGAASATPDMLVLDIGSAEPTGTVGAMYYSTALSKFRCYQGAAWADCIGTGGGHTQNTDTGTTGVSFIVGSSTDSSTTNTTLQFGSTNPETLYFDGASTDNFKLSDDIDVTGGITTTLGVSIGAGQAYGGAGAVTLSSTTNGLTLNSGDNTLTVDSSDTAISATGVTTLTLAANTSITNATGNITLQPAGSGTIANVQIGAGGAGSTTPDYLALDVKSDTGDPAGGFEGAMYYNTADNKFRCYQGSAWTDCIGTGGSGPWTDGTGITYLTDTAEDFAVGGSDLASPFSVDVSLNTARIGSGATNNAILNMYASNAATGSLEYTTNDSWYFNGGNVGLGTSAPTNILSLGNTQAQKIWIEDTASGTAGRALTMAAGGTVAGGTNIVGGNLILQSGLGTGTGASTISFQTGTTLTSGTTLQTMSTKMTILGNGNVGIGTTNPNNSLQVTGLVNFDNARYSTSLGYQAGNVNAANYNTFVGYQAGRLNSGGSLNSAVGNNALQSNTSGSNNTAVGQNALGSNSTGVSNSAFGAQTLIYANATGNSAFGTFALQNTTAGSNTGMGFQALNTNTSGANNVALGYQAGFSGSGSDNIFLGYNAGYSETGSNKLYIDNSNTTAPLIYGDFSTNAISINGTFGILETGTTPTYKTIFQGGDQTGADITYTLPVDGMATTGLLKNTNGVWSWDTSAYTTHSAVTLGTANGLSLSTQQLSLGVASSGVTGALTGTDWDSFNGKMTNPMTTAGDIIYGGASGAPTRLGEGTNDGYVLKINTTTHVPYWSADLQGGGHTQNTDTGTTGVSFIVGSATDSATTNTTLQFGSTNSETLYFDGASTDNFKLSDDLDVTGGLTTTLGVSIGAGQTYGGAGAVTLSSTTNGLTLNSGDNTLTIDSSDTALTASGVTTLTLGAGVSITNASGNIGLQAAGTGTANVQIGDGGATSATPDMLVLDIGSAEPTGTVGAMYYSTALSKFRCYQGAAWTDCIGAGGSQTPWAQDISAAGYDLGNLSNLGFQETTGAPTGTDVGLYRDNTGDLTANVLTGKTFNFAVNGTDEFNFSSTGLAFNGNNITGLGTNLTATAGLTIASAAASGLTLDSGTTGAISIGDDGSAETITIGTGAAAKTLTIGSTNTTSTTNIQSGSGGINIKANNGSTGTVQIGTGGAGSNTPDIFALDVKNNTGDPTGFEGAMYYNTADNKFRCYQDAAWTDCIGSGTGGSPGGSANQVQYNNGAGGFAGATNLEIENNYLRLPVASVPATAPAANGLDMYARSIGGRIMPVFMGPSGLDATIQPSIGRNKVAWWNPAGNSTTISAVGAAGLTATGTATASNVATTTRHTWMKRLDYLVTTAATTAVAGFRGGVALYTRGGATAGDGGFHMITTWGPATGVATTTNRAFVGMTSSTAAPTDVQPSSLTNMMGFGWDAADTNIQFMHNDGTGTATKVDLGASFPVPTADRAKMYETIIFVAPGNGSTIGYRITDLATGAIAEGTVSTDLVANTTFLAPRGWMSVGGTSSVIGIALSNLYIETDF